MYLRINDLHRVDPPGSGDDSKRPAPDPEIRPPMKVSPGLCLRRDLAMFH
jgi:hypothetical protein